MNIRYPIKRGGKIPPPGKPGRPRIYPLDEMKVGDHFFADGVSYQSVYSSIKWFQSHQKGRKFQFFIKPETGRNPGVSVWRTE